MNCKIRKCDRKADKKQMCLAHYQRWVRNGDNFDRSPIVNVSSLLSRFKSKIQKKNKNGCMLWTGWKNNDGYGKFSVGKKYKLAHRVAYELFVGKIPEGLYVLHKCDVRDCCNIEHLYLGDQFDNMHDCLKRDRFALRSGQNNGRSLLKEKDVKYIKVSLGKASGAQLAREFKVSESCIQDIKHKRSWKDIHGE